ncbi:AcrR family transcriptional regulator [Deinococcus metalli]|uniref:AcrR family transcriptional regulator n=1 Tax=Deinococcus metalli TaxID=1141878 RepID=A0A7W8NQR2_9DEIO|nr:TetR/AcrR family transcriptional regulator [Deinococcus metalli]MBB5375352.1 AcrR family transcriptional regulator [Deinococcus metalli]GHF29934.1 TetR family transcriptional regulator [Deinococcus metalli]
MPYPSKLTPETIEEVAWTLFQAGGPDALSMRSLADALGVRAGSLYRHVDSRDALLHALAQRAARDLQAELVRAAEGHLPRNALQAAAGAYLHYARTHPHAYALLLVPDAHGPANGLATDAGKALWNTLLGLVGALSGDLDDTDHAVAVWTFLHGAASLDRAGIYGGSGPRGGIDLGVNAILDHAQDAGRRKRPS